MARPKVTDADPDDAPLKRLGGGRWQTRDERFTVEPQSGTWVVVDAEQTDDLGLPLVRGPFRSLGEAKSAIQDARTSTPAESPLVGRIERRRREPAAAAMGGRDRDVRGTPRTARQLAGGPRTSGVAPAEKPVRGARPAGPSRGGDAHHRVVRGSANQPAEPAEPGWIMDLAATERGRARRLIAILSDDGVEDAEGIVRRDIVGGVSAIAAGAISRRIAALPDHAGAHDVVALLAEGRDDKLGVRWRIVDGDGRPITLDRKR
jgi:hypothetical protein